MNGAPPTQSHRDNVPYLWQRRARAREPVNLAVWHESSVVFVLRRFLFVRLQSQQWILKFNSHCLLETLRFWLCGLSDFWPETAVYIHILPGAAFSAAFTLCLPHVQINLKRLLRVIVSNSLFWTLWLIHSKSILLCLYMFLLMWPLAQGTSIFVPWPHIF